MNNHNPYDIMHLEAQISTLKTRVQALEDSKNAVEGSLRHAKEMLKLAETCLLNTKQLRLF